MLEQLSRGRHVAGLKQARKAVSHREALMAFVADDADAPLRAGFISLCAECGVPVFHVRSMQELGRACGIGIGAGFAALLK
jgi:large subunit ribosomal protein L7A